MRHVKVIAGLIVAVCAFGATAATALAVGFESKPNKKTEDLTFKEYGAKTGELSEQTFKIGPIKYTGAAKETVEVSWKIKCANAKGTGEAPPEAKPSETLTVEARYSKCTYTGTGATVVGGKAPTASFLGQKESPPTFGYSTDGTVELEDAIEIKLAGPKCIVTIPAQASEPFESYVPAKYANSGTEAVSKAEKEEFPSGFRNRLIVANNIVPHKAHAVEKPKEIVPSVGLAYEVAPFKSPKTGKPLASSACTNIPETEEIEVEHFKGEKVKEPVHPRDGVNGSYSGSLKLELPKGELKVTL